MSAFINWVPIVLKGLAALLVFAAVGALLLSNRLSLQLKQKYWSGAKVSSVDNERARARISALRIGAGICAAIAAVSFLVTTTLQAYLAA